MSVLTTAGLYDEMERFVFEINTVDYLGCRLKIICPNMDFHVTGDELLSQGVEHLETNDLYRDNLVLRIEIVG